VAPPPPLLLGGVAGGRWTQSASPPSVIVRDFPSAPVEVRMSCPAMPASRLVSQPPYWVGEAPKVIPVEIFC
jgi:hypothetical protein